MIPLEDRWSIDPALTIPAPSPNTDPALLIEAWRQAAHATLTRCASGVGAVSRLTAFAALHVLVDLLAAVALRDEPTAYARFRTFQRLTRRNAKTPLLAN